VSSFCPGLIQNSCYLVRCQFLAGELVGGDGVAGMPRGEGPGDQPGASSWHLPGANYHRPILRTTNLLIKKKRTHF